MTEIRRFTGHVIGVRRVMNAGSFVYNGFESELEITLEPDAKYPTARRFSIPGQFLIGATITLTLEVEQ